MQADNIDIFRDALPDFAIKRHKPQETVRPPVPGVTVWVDRNCFNLHAAAKVIRPLALRSCGGTADGHAQEQDTDMQQIAALGRTLAGRHAAALGAERQDQRVREQVLSAARRGLAWIMVLHRTWASR
jgi:hypothetical protein